MVIGGCDGNSRLDSVEVYDWTKGAWSPGPSMRNRRSGMPSFVYRQRAFVAGGKDRGGRRSFEVLNLAAHGEARDRLEEWRDFEARLDRKSWGHSASVYQDRLIVIGGYNGEVASRDIYELRLSEEYGEARVCCQLDDALWNHSAQRIGDKIYIFGGMMGAENYHSVNSVWEYDIPGERLRELRPLPYKVNGHATVCLGESEVLILGGSCDDEQRLRTVLKYDVLNQRYTTLPPMNHARDGFAAALTGNALVVAGGLHESSEHGIVYMNSAEYFNFARYEWNDLPPLNTGRSYPTAIVRPNFHQV